MGGPVCTACLSPDVAEIDTDLAGGVPQRVVATRYGLSRSVVNRHKLAHLPKSLVAVTSSNAPLVPETVLEQIERLVAMVHEILAIALQTNPHTAIAAINSAARLLELVAKITGQLNERPIVVINLETSQEWLAMRTAMLSILDHHPDALRQVRDVLRLEAPPA